MQLKIAAYRHFRSFGFTKIIAMLMANETNGKNAKTGGSEIVSKKRFPVSRPKNKAIKRTIVGIETRNISKSFIFRKGH